MDRHTQERPATTQRSTRTPISSTPTRQWVRTVPAARIQWGKLSVEELLDTQGDPYVLSTLVQKRYALTRDQADDEVAGFLNSCSHWF